MKRRALVAIGIGLAIGPMVAVGAPSPKASSSAPAVASSAPPAISASAAPSSSPSVADGGVDDAGSVYATCTEHLAEGAARPKMTEHFPLHGTAGWALPLTVDIEHGAGETVLPQGFSIQSAGVEAEALSRAGFTVPSIDGGAPPRIEPIPEAKGKKTRVTIEVMALPKEPGRHDLILPPLPIAVARANGDLSTLCTSPHAVVVEDPTASTPDAKPKPNPEPRRQIEAFEALRRALEFLAVATIAAIAGALLYRWWRRRPRPVPPPPPPRPAWESALEALHALRSSSMIRDEKLAEYVDAVSDIVRRYLGERYGFDGLEATSREVRRSVRGVVPPLPVLAEIDRLLDESDLVKFARVTPSPEDCEALWSLGERIVRQTMPAAPSPVNEPVAAGGTP